MACVWDSPTFQQLPLRQQIAMVFGAAMEGGVCGPFPTGDGGCSHGPFQMNQCGGAGSGLPVSCLIDPECAVQHMAPTYAACMGAGDNVHIVGCAERPAGGWQAYGPSQLAAATAAVRQFLSGNPQPTTPTTPTSPSASSFKPEDVSAGSKADCLRSCLAYGPGTPAYVACVADCVAGHPIGGIVERFNPVADFIEFLNRILQFFTSKKTWERVAIFIIGLVAIIGGGLVLANAAGVSSPQTMLLKAATK